MERAEPSSSVRADIVFGLVLIAQLNLVRGNLEEGAKFIEEATRELDRTDMRHYEAELHRTRGEISLLEGKCGDAQARFEQAIEAAWTQGARSWELRAALSLARLWQSQGIAGEARALLTPIYAWFTEGFDTADLLDARALLKSLVE